MSDENEKLKIDLVKKKPHKVYKIELKYGYQIKELCKFLRNNKDKIVSTVINGKHIKFSSVAGKKRFAEGYQQSTDFVFNHVSRIVKEAEEEIDALEEELEITEKIIEHNKEEAVKIREELRVNSVVKILRQAASADC